MSSQLTERQQKVYNMIRGLIVKRGYGPTVREIGEHFGIKSPNGVMCHLRALERKGLITRSPNKSRAIELTQSADRNGHSMPLRGMVSADPSQLAKDSNERIDFSEKLFGEHRFVLQVSGDFLVDAQIADGDFVIVEEAQSATPGQLAAVQLESGEIVVRYWFPEIDRFRLEPANQQMDSIVVRSAVLVGICVGIVRPCLV